MVVSTVCVGGYDLVVVGDTPEQNIRALTKSARANGFTDHHFRCGSAYTFINEEARHHHDVEHGVVQWP